MHCDSCNGVAVVFLLFVRRHRQHKFHSVDLAGGVQRTGRHRRASFGAFFRGDLPGLGLVNRLAAPGREYEEALALARAIASKSSYVQKIGKEAYYNQRDMSLADAFKYGAKVMAENMMARDAEEGIGAFIEKRDPKWEDR